LYECCASFPKTYTDRLRLRFAPLLKLHLKMNTRVLRSPPALGVGRAFRLYYGPFPSAPRRKNSPTNSLDFFKMRRCVDDLHPTPSFRLHLFRDENVPRALL